jgi:hypothetical protein
MMQQLIYKAQLSQRRLLTRAATSCLPAIPFEGWTGCIKAHSCRITPACQTTSRNGMPGQWIVPWINGTCSYTNVCPDFSRFSWVCVMLVKMSFSTKLQDAILQCGAERHLHQHNTNPRELGEVQAYICPIGMSHLSKGQSINSQPAGMECHGPFMANRLSLLICHGPFIMLSRCRFQSCFPCNGILHDMKRSLIHSLTHLA